MLGSSFYEFELREGGDLSSLCIVLSQAAKPVFRNFDYGMPTLFGWEERSTYHVRHAARIARNLAAFIEDRGISKVCLIGCSKAGYGALLWGSLLAQRWRGTVAAIAFSPQTRVYPKNDALVFPSYLRMLERAGKDAALMADLERHGSLTGMDRKNFRARVIYPTKVKEDAAEAERLSGIPNIELVPISLSIHTTVIPFTVDTTKEADVRNRVARLLEVAGGDDDVASFAKTRREEQLVEEYLAVGAQPKLPDLVRGALAS